MLSNSKAPVSSAMTLLSARLGESSGRPAALAMIVLKTIKRKSGQARNESAKELIVEKGRRVRLAEA